MSAIEARTLSFSDAVDLITSSHRVLNRDYRDAGRYPIVDQGQSLIGGWTDDPTGLVSNELPVVVFGDHTRAFKFVDFPFVRGADGTQILKPKPGIDARFFYFACLSLDIPSRGYNRHFSEVKKLTVTLPPEDRQRDIAACLALVERGLLRFAETERCVDDLKRAVMRELFTRGLRREGQRDSEIGSLPTSWDVIALGDLGRVGNGSTPKKSIRGYWEDGTYPWLASAKVYDREIEVANQFVTEAALNECHLPRLRPGCVLVAITGQGKTLGHCAVLRIEATINQHLAYVDVNQSLADPSFVRGYLETRYDYLRQVASGGGSTKGALTCSFLRELKIPLPSLDEQGKIVAILDAIDQKIALHKRKRAVLEELFNALLHKLITGEIRASDLNLPALEAPLVRQVPA